jgi:membrane protein implicated in regulation of membrane protease activity
VASLLWIVLAVALCVAEVFTGTFVLVMLALGALVASVPAALGAPPWLQALTFAIVSLMTLVGIRPAIQRRLHRDSASSPMGLQAIEGSDGLVLETIDLDHGLVKIDGELWSARPYDASQTFHTGEHVRVIEVRGATALVWRD